jgi:hypothetical protein
VDRPNRSLDPDDGTRRVSTADDGARADDGADRDSNVRRAASRYPLWLIYVGVVVVVLIVLYVATMLLPGAATGPGP